MCLAAAVGGTLLIVLSVADRREPEHVPVRVAADRRDARDRPR